MKIKETAIFIVIMFCFGMMGISDAEHIETIEKGESIEPIVIAPTSDEQRWVVSNEQLESLCVQYEELKRRHDNERTR